MTRSYKTSYKSHRSSTRFHLTFAPPLPPLTEVERIQANLRRERDFIAAHPNYTYLCDEARVRLLSYQRLLTEHLDTQGVDLIDISNWTEKEILSQWFEDHWDAIPEVTL